MELSNRYDKLEMPQSNTISDSHDILEEKAKMLFNQNQQVTSYGNVVPKQKFSLIFLCFFFLFRFCTFT